MFTTPEAVAEKLIKLRDSLIKLKQDRTTYVKSSSVVRLYDELCEYIRQAQEFESELLNGPRESGSKREITSLKMPFCSQGRLEFIILNYTHAT